MKSSDVTSRYKRLCDELAGLRLEREKAEAKFFVRLYDVEQQEMELLRAAGCDTFDRFLKSTALADSSRYRNFVKGFEKVGRDVALVIGADAVIEAAAIIDGAETVDRYQAAIVDWKEEHRGVHPSREQSARLLRQIEPRAEIPEAVRTQSEIRRLRNEVARLKAENADLKYKLVLVTKERDQLKTKQRSRAQHQPRA